MQGLAASLMAAIVVCATCVTAEEDVKRLEGRYERTVTNEAGTMFRVVKDVIADQSTVTTYDDVGRIVEEHTSTFKVETRGDVRVLTFFDLKVTAGTAKGREQKEPRSFIYRLEGDNFAEAWGLLEGDRSPPRIIFWKKVK